MNRVFSSLALFAVLGVCSSGFAGKGVKPESNGAGKSRDAAQVFKKLDANGDGKLTIDEFKGKKDEERAKKAFAKLDANSDGAITADEFKLRERKPKKTE